MDYKITEQPMISAAGQILESIYDRYGDPKKSQDSTGLSEQTSKTKRSTSSLAAQITLVHKVWVVEQSP